MAGGVGVARVERGGERLDGADIGQLGLRLGRLQRGDHLVERVGERVELEAGAGARDLLREVARVGDLPEVLRQLVDRSGQGARQPEAGQAAQQHRADRDKRQHLEGIARRAVRANRFGRVVGQRPAGVQTAQGVGLVGQVDQPVDRQPEAWRMKALRTPGVCVLPTMSPPALMVTCVRIIVDNSAA